MITGGMKDGTKHVYEDFKTQMSFKRFSCKILYNIYIG